MNLDAHTNLGKFPTSRTSDRCHETTVDEMVQFLTENGIDAHICLYPKEGYHLLEELATRLPTVKHIGLQVVMGYDAADATDITKFVYDVNIPERNWQNGGHCYGIKLASHRGWWNRDSKVNSGLNYGDSRFIGGILKKLPESAIASFHMQGEPAYGLPHHPTMIGMYATRFTKLKFIMNHCGDYGQAMFSNRPSSYRDKIAPAFRHAHSRALIYSCIMFANDMHNILIDSSIHTPTKGILLQKCKRWAIGSDFPFQREIDKLYLNERRRFELIGHPLEKIYENNHKTMEWIHNNWEKNLSEHEEEYNHRFVIERKKQPANVLTNEQIYL